MRRVALSVVLVLAGLTAGLVVSGRMRATSDAAAVEQAAPAQAVRPRAEAAPTATPGPDFTRVA